MMRAPTNPTKTLVRGMQVRRKALPTAEYGPTFRECWGKADCQEEEEELDKAEEKIAEAKGELEKEEIKSDAADAEALKERAAIIAQQEDEDAEDEAISEEG